MIAPHDDMTREQAIECAERNAQLAREAFEMTDEFVRVWNSLDWKTQRIVSYAIGHEAGDSLGLDKLADELSGDGYTMTKQGVWARLDLACRENPAIEETIRGRSPSWRDAQEVAG